MKICKLLPIISLFASLYGCSEEQVPYGEIEEKYISIWEGCSSYACIKTEIPSNYTIVNQDEEIASAIIDDTDIYIITHKSGSTTVQLIDSGNNQTVCEVHVYVKYFNSPDISNWGIPLTEGSPGYPGITVQATDTAVIPVIQKEIIERNRPFIQAAYTFNQNTKKFTMETESGIFIKEGTYEWNKNSLTLMSDGKTERFGFKFTSGIWFGHGYIIQEDKTGEYRQRYPDAGITEIKVNHIWKENWNMQFGGGIDTKNAGGFYDLSESEALEIAEIFHESVTPQPKTRDGNTAFEIKSAYRIHASEKTRTVSNGELPLIYEIKINDGGEGGKMLVSGDKRCPEVLAYIPLYSDSLYKTSTAPDIMMQMAKNAFMDKIQNCNYTSSTRSLPIQTIPGEVSVMIVPFCTTNWCQFAPYNQLLPKAFIERYERKTPNRPGGALYGNYPTGQASVAIAQMMAYLKPHLNIDGINMDWDRLTLEKEVMQSDEKMAATLLKYIYNAIGAYPVWGECYNYDKWTATGPSTEIVNSVLAVRASIRDISKFLNNASQCGLTCDATQKWNLNAVKESLFSLHPVFAGDLNTVGFLIDGYAINEENSVYLHCNFGMSERFNGYYGVYDKESVVFNTGGYLYRDTNLYIIANVRNK